MPTTIKESYNEAREKRRAFLAFLNKNSRKVILAVVLLAIFSIASFAAIVQYNKNLLDPDVVAKVGNKEITRQDLNTALYARNFDGSIDKPATVSQDVKKEVASELIEGEIAKQYAQQKLGINLSDHDILSAVAGNMAKEQYDKMSADQRKAVKFSWENTLYIQAVKNKILGWKEGDYLLFRFDKYIDYKDDKKIEGVGNQKLIDEQRDYSQKLAGTISAQLQSGQITFDQAKKTLENDLKANAVAFAPRRVNIEGVFDQNDFLEERSFFDTSVYEGFKDGMTSLKEGGVSAPILLKANVEGKYVDFAYAVVKIDKSGAGNVYSYKDWLANQKKELNVVNNLDKESIFKVSVSFVARAFAAIAQACSIPYSGTEKTDLKVQTVYKGTDGLDHPISGLSMTVHAGSSSAGNGLTLSRSSDCGGGWYSYSVNRTTDGNGYVDLSNNTGGSPGVINCDHTSAATFVVPNSVSISGATGGYWEVDLSTSTYKQWYLNSYQESGKFAVGLNLGTTTSWANGTQVVKKIRWVPNYVAAQFTTEVWYWNYRLSDFVNIAQPGDQMGLEIYVTPSANLNDIWIRDNINNNSVNNTAGDGSTGNPYSIRAVASSVCLTTACGDLQNVGNYSSTDPTNKLQWASHSVYSGQVIVGDYYQVDVQFTVANNSALIGTFVNNGEHAWSSPRGDSNTADWIPSGGLYAQGGFNIVAPQVTLTAAVSPAGAGTISGGLGGVDGLGINCPGTNCSTNFYQNDTTDLTASANSGWAFSGWTGSCSGTNPFTGSIAMSSSKTCTANFYNLTASLTATPSSGNAPLNNVSLRATAGGSATGNITYKFDCTNDGTWNDTPAATTTNPYTSTACSYTTAGTYTAKVEIDRGALVATATATITVSPPPACSVSTFTANGSTGPLSINRGSSVTFVKSAANSTSTSFTNGDTTNSDQLTHQYNTNGTYSASYSCTGLGGNDTHTINITVSDTCSIDTATASDTDPNNYAPLTATLGGTYSTTYASPIQFSWSLSGGVPSLINWNASPSGTTVYNTGGNTYTATLSGRINDGFGTSCGSRSVSTNVVVKPFVSCNVTPTDGLAPLTVKISWDTDPTGGSATFDLKDGSPTKVFPTSVKTFYYTYSGPGTYPISVTNSSGSDTCSTQDGTKDGVIITAPNSGSGGEVTPKQ